MERATKERLTGAVILVAALAILVPEMLSGPGDHAVTDADGAVADTGPPLTTYDLAIDPGAAPAASRQRQLSGVASEGEAIAQAVPPPVTGPARPDGGGAEGSAAGPADPATRESPASAPEVETRVTVDTPSRTAAVPPPATASKASNAATGSWWVQLGSFSSQQNAQGLARKLRADGYAIDVTLVRSGGKDLHRVRAGPEQDRAAATALRARLAAAGQSGTLVAP